MESKAVAMLCTLPGGEVVGTQGGKWALIFHLGVLSLVELTWFFEEDKERNPHPFNIISPLPWCLSFAAFREDRIP